MDSELTELMTIVTKILKTGLFVDWRVIQPFEERLMNEADEELSNNILMYDVNKL